MGTPMPSAPFRRCRVGRRHDSVVRTTEDGGRLQVCRLHGTHRGPISNLPTTSPPQRGPR